MQDRIDAFSGQLAACDDAHEIRVIHHHLDDSLAFVLANRRQATRLFDVIEDDEVAVCLVKWMLLQWAETRDISYLLAYEWDDVMHNALTHLAGICLSLEWRWGLVGVFIAVPEVMRAVSIQSPAEWVSFCNQADVSVGMMAGLLLQMPRPLSEAVMALWFTFQRRAFDALVPEMVSGVTIGPIKISGRAVAVTRLETDSYNTLIQTVFQSPTYEATLALGGYLVSHPAEQDRFVDYVAKRFHDPIRSTAVFKQWKAMRIIAKMIIHDRLDHVVMTCFSLTLSRISDPRRRETLLGQVDERFREAFLSLSS